MTAMANATGPLRRDPVTGLLGVALFVLIAGLVGMHGLGRHGIGDTGHGGVSLGWTLSMHEGIDADPAEAALAAGDARHSSGIGELCLAVLSIVGLTLVLALACPRGDGRAVTHSPVPRAGRAVSQASGPDPPSLAALSVLRC